MIRGLCGVTKTFPPPGLPALEASPNCGGRIKVDFADGFNKLTIEPTSRMVHHLTATHNMTKCLC